MTPDLPEKLARRLPDKWRKEAAEYEEIYKARGWDGHFRAQAVKKACADELETWLREVHLDELLAAGHGKTKVHVYRDGPNCGFVNDKAEVCGKPHDEGRHIRYGPQVDYPGYHYFEPEQIHDVENCFTCAVDAAKKAFEESLE